MSNFIVKVVIGTLIYCVTSFAFVWAFYDKIMAWSIKASMKMIESMGNK